jgi:hypothetical protein
MAEERLSKLEVSLVNLNDKFSEFIAIESARKERDKQQLEINKTLLDHIKNYQKEDKPVVERARKWQSWLDDFIGKKVIPLAIGLVFLAALSAAGYGIIGK